MTVGAEAAAMGVGRALVWRMLAPIRWYLRRFPIDHGKGILLRRLVVPILPRTGSFISDMPGGVKIRLLFRETLGLSSLLYGPFERAELEMAIKLTSVGDTVIDVGANVGLYAVALGRAVGPSGGCLAVEPLPDNVDRLKGNIELNNLGNVSVLQCAVGRDDGTVTLRLADDPAYASTETIAESRGTGESLTVPLTTLDRLWSESGRPRVSFVKIDVEGGEEAALAGAANLLEQCRPALLVEAHGHDQVGRLYAYLSSLGYVYTHPAGFKPWNHLFRVSNDNDRRK